MLQCFGEQILFKLMSWCALELHGILGCWLEVGTVSHDAIYLFSLVLSVFLTPNIGRRQAQSVKCPFPPCKHEDLSFQRWRDGGRQIPATHWPAKPKWDTVSVPVGLLWWVPLRLSSRLCTHIHMCLHTTPMGILSTCMYTRIHSGMCTHRIHMHKRLRGEQPESARTMVPEGPLWTGDGLDGLMLMLFLLHCPPPPHFVLWAYSYR